MCHAEVWNRKGTSYFKIIKRLFDYLKQLFDFYNKMLLLCKLFSKL